MAPMAPRKRARYCCGLCGLPKKGHVCRFAGGSSSARVVQGREEAAPPTDPAPAGAKKEEVTIITALPNDVLGTIISAIPIDEAARTNAISKGWKHLWRDQLVLNRGRNSSDHGAITGWEPSRDAIAEKTLSAVITRSLRETALNPFVVAAI